MNEHDRLLTAEGLPNYPEVPTGTLYAWRSGERVPWPPTPATPGLRASWNTWRPMWYLRLDPPWKSTSTSRLLWIRLGRDAWPVSYWGWSPRPPRSLPWWSASTLLPGLAPL